MIEYGIGGGKIIMEGDSKITGNRVGNVNRDVLIHAAIQGGLTLSGNAQIGQMAVTFSGDFHDESRGLIIIPAPFTGSLTFFRMYLDPNAPYWWVWGQDIKVLIEGTTSYNITQDDIDRFTLTPERNLKPIANNKVEVY